MTVRRDLQLGLLALVALHLLLAFGAIGLLGRMGPAINRILEENAATIAEVTEMLAVLGTQPGAADPAASERFARALRAALDNVTEEQERPLLNRIQQHHGAALAGDPMARQAVVADLRQLAGVNGAVMAAADARARRLGSAGAWATVLLALFTVLVSALVVRRLNRRVALPVEELRQVLDASRQGDRFRRCQDLEAAAELREVLRSVNVLLDRIA